ncbi:hypothetical protein KL905_001545 [Ogataea polymorpha]|nr:hypothetical protein KL908_000540 [Ogataea polymorpha]KAG7903055.1 hypothetical protein KL935_000587 [Ogataea polymorpha]KAG7912338.1 hypothetical protein KL906_000542 [Ogataea polymorpha]KAG7913091.1 hypothetical protein KL907_000036 [Ogataea polymorpha]KAG7919899.1 hypothetical protein KL927_000579 [Ogataea polymorpha]
MVVHILGKAIKGKAKVDHAHAPAKRNTGDGSDQGAYRHDHRIETVAAGAFQHQAQAGDRFVPGSQTRNGTACARSTYQVQRPYCKTFE